MANTSLVNMRSIAEDIVKRRMNRVPAEYARVLCAQEIRMKFLCMNLLSIFDCFYSNFRIEDENEFKNFEIMAVCVCVRA